MEVKHQTHRYLASHLMFSMGFPLYGYFMTASTPNFAYVIARCELLHLEYNGFIIIPLCGGETSNSTILGWLVGIRPRSPYKIIHTTTVWARTTTVDTTGKQLSGPNVYQGFPL